MWHLKQVLLPAAEARTFIDQELEQARATGVARFSRHSYVPSSPSAQPSMGRPSTRSSGRPSFVRNSYVPHTHWQGGGDSAKLAALPEDVSYRPPKRDSMV